METKMTNKLPSLILTNRDLAVLKMVYDFGGCTAEHIRKKFFPTNGARSACYARIAKLVDGEYLTSVRLPSFYGIGSGKAFLTPGPKARPILAEMLGLSRTELGRIRVDSPLFIQHHLNLCDIRVSVELASEKSPIFNLVEWTGDHELRQTPNKIVDPQTKKIVSFVPDASFVLSLSDGSEQTFLLEMDLSTLSPKRCREKLRCYLVHGKKHPSPVLFITPDLARRDAMAKWAEEEAEKLKADPTIFWVTTKGQITENTFLNEPIWLIPGGPKELALESLAISSKKVSNISFQPFFA